MGQAQVTPSKAPTKPFMPLAIYSQDPTFVTSLLSCELDGRRSDFKTLVKFTAKVIDMGDCPLQICQHGIMHGLDDRLYHLPYSAALSREYFCYKEYNIKQSSQIEMSFPNKLHVEDLTFATDFIEVYKNALDVIFESFQQENLYIGHSSFSDVDFIFEGPSIPMDKITIKQAIKIPKEVDMILSAVHLAFIDCPDQNIMKKFTLLVLFCPEDMIPCILEMYRICAYALVKEEIREDDSYIIPILEHMKACELYNEYLVDYNIIPAIDSRSSKIKSNHSGFCDAQIKSQFIELCGRRRDMMIRRARDELNPKILKFFKSIPQNKDTKPARPCM
ncbi:queG [Acrasis kona]|uniref:QueG n=1 Tax=Acrasis kona TaxID=1008807 RepID=A0AAW2YM28_9EUKA